jgi:hypothetical protein
LCSRYQASLGSLHSETVYSSVKCLLYLFFLILLPINEPVALQCYIGASIASFADKVHPSNNSLLKASFWQRVVIDEDSFTSFNILHMAFCKQTYRFAFILTLVAWACVNLAEIGQRLTQNRRIVGLSLLRPMFLAIIVKEFFILQIKSHFEVFIILLSPFWWLGGGCAPIVPLLSFQLLRVRYVISEFTRQSFVALEGLLVTYLPASTIPPLQNKIKPYLLTYVGGLGKAPEDVKESAT